MAQSLRKLSVFSLSAVDLFSCAFGGLVLILILFISQSSVLSSRDEPFCVVTITVFHWTEDTAPYDQAFLLNGRPLGPGRPGDNEAEGADTFISHVEVLSSRDRRAYDAATGMPVRRIETGVFRLTKLSDDPVVTYEINDKSAPGFFSLTGRRGMSATLPARIDVSVYSSQRDEFSPPIFRSFRLTGGALRALAEADFGKVALAIRLSGEAGSPLHSVALSNDGTTVLRLFPKDLQQGATP
jgi:hypothetical protein